MTTSAKPFSTRTAMVLVGLVAVALPLSAAPPVSQFALTGAVAKPATFRLADLQKLPAVTQTVSFGSGSGAQTHTYTGADLWGLLSSAGIVTDPAKKNDLLGRYVLATGSDGYRAAFSLGELSPDFGHRGSLVAYAETTGGKSAPLGADGFARITAPGDGKGGRYVSNLVDLDVRASGSTQTGTGGGVSTRFSVGGGVQHPASFDLAALKALKLPEIQRTIGSDTYTGVSFWDLLNTTAGLVLDPTVKNDVLNKVVVATGSDGYQALYALGELSPDFGADSVRGIRT